MDAALNSHKSVNGIQRAINTFYLWCFFLPLAIFLALMVKFPIRFTVEYSFDDVLLFGAISLACIRASRWIYRKFGKHSYRLITLVLLCSLLSGWQVIDLAVLRRGDPSVMGFGSAMNPNFTLQDGIAWYTSRFPNKNIRCNSIYERYIGNDNIAIAVEINRDATWFVCGG